MWHGFDFRVHALSANAEEPAVRSATGCPTESFRRLTPLPCPIDDRILDFHPFIDGPLGMVLTRAFRMLSRVLCCYTLLVATKLGDESLSKAGEIFKGLSSIANGYRVQ